LTYYYRVRATNERGDGDESPVAYATTAGNWSTALAVPIEDYSVFIGCKTNGTLWRWGGSGAPSQVGTGNNWSTVAAGNGANGSEDIDGPYFFARQTNGTLWSWGDNFRGQLGLGDTIYDGDMGFVAGIARDTPTQVVGSFSDWSTVACGAYFTIAIKTNRTIWSCGWNASGQLGQGTGGPAADLSTFTKIGADADWSIVAAGETHSIALKTNGTIWTWGDNSAGQLGRSESGFFSPAPVGTASDWSKVTCGQMYTIAIKTNGTLWSWGKNDYGELGVNDTTIRTTPTQEFTSASDWSAVAGGAGLTIGSGYTLALKTNGSLWAWGFGYGVNPSRIGSDTDWTTIKGGLLSIARKTNGTLWVVTGSTPTLVGE
jgi:hypothetical protein